MTGYAHLGRHKLSRSDRDKLVVDHAPAARRIALRVARRLPDRSMTEDVISAAYLGLTQAAERYDAKRGEPFLAFAEQRIRGAVYDELRRADILPRRLRGLANRVRDAVRELEQSKGRVPEDEEVAEHLGVSVSEYTENLEHLSHVAIVELKTEEIAGGASNEAATPESAATKRDLVQKVLAAIKTLPERDAQVLSLYYIEGFSYAEIGEVFGVTVGRISQLHARAIAKIRAGFVDEEQRRSKVA